VKAAFVALFVLLFPWSAPLREAWTGASVLSSVRDGVVDASTEVRVGGVRARRWGAEGAPRMVLVHGAHPEGIDEPRMLALGTAFSREGFEVWAPVLPAMADARVEASDVAVLRGVLDEVAPAAVVAISVGGSVALRVLEGRADVPALLCIGTPAGYAEMARFHLGASGHPYGRAVLAHTLARELGLDRETTRGDVLAGARAEPVRVASSVLSEALAPLRVLEVRRARGAPTWVLHGAGDPIVPERNASRICERLGERCRDSLISPALGHAQTNDASFGDQLRLARFVSRFVRATQRPAS